MIKLGISQKLNILIIGVTLSIVSIFSAYVFFNISDNARERVNEHLSSVATYEKIYLDYFFSSTVKELNLVTSRTHFRENLLAYHQTQDQKYLHKIAKILTDANNATDTFYSLTLTTTDGKTLFSNDISDKTARCKVNLTNYPHISKTYIPICFKEKDNDTSYMRMRSPVIHNAETIALLYAAINLKPLDELSNIRKRLEYKTADSVVVYYRDEDALFLTPVTYDEKAALTRTIALQNMDISYNKARNHPDGEFITGLDYRGVPVYSYVTYLSQYNIGLSVELDMDELKAIESKKVGFSLLMLTSLIIMAGVFTVLMIKQLLKPLHKLHDVIVKQSLSTGKLVQCKHLSNDEFGELAHSYNKMIERIQEQSITDALTQLHNRKAFNERIEELIAQYHRYQIPFSVLMLDIDHFKSVNDTYGHQMGDKVLIALSNELKSHIRKNDYVFRYGGEEFIILLTGTTIDQAKIFAEKLRSSVQATIHVIEERKITISIGVSEFHREDSSDSIVKRVDDNLYRAKESGRNRVCIDESRPSTLN